MCSSKTETSMERFGGTFTVRTVDTRFRITIEHDRFDQSRRHRFAKQMQKFVVFLLSRFPPLQHDCSPSRSFSLHFRTSQAMCIAWKFPWLARFSSRCSARSTCDSVFLNFKEIGDNVRDETSINRRNCYCCWWLWIWDRCSADTRFKVPIYI